MDEAVVTCAKCAARRTFRGTSWEVKVMADVWQNEHERAERESEARQTRAVGRQSCRRTIGTSGDI
jgi:hypothetical protein